MPSFLSLSLLLAFLRHLPSSSLIFSALRLTLLWRRTKVSIRFWTWLHHAYGTSESSEFCRSDVRFFFEDQQDVLQPTFWRMRSSIRVPSTGWLLWRVCGHQEFKTDRAFISLKDRAWKPLRNKPIASAYISVKQESEARFIYMPLFQTSFYYLLFNARIIASSLLTTTAVCALVCASPSTQSKRPLMKRFLFSHQRSGDWRERNLQQLQWIQSEYFLNTKCFNFQIVQKVVIPF